MSNSPSLIFAQYQGAPLEYTDVLADCNLVFTILFTIECAMKLTSFGPKVNDNDFLYALHSNSLFYSFSAALGI